MAPLLLLAACGPRGAGPEPAASSVVEVHRWHVAESASSPEVLSSLLTQFYDLTVLLAVRQGGRALEVVVASQGPDGQQDRCAPTTTLSGVALGADGAFTAAAPEIRFTASRLPAGLTSVELAGTFAPGALSLDSVRGQIDTREFVPLLGSGPETALCEVMPAMGPCVPCADGTSACRSVSFTAARPLPVGVAVEPRAAAEICADPACAGAPVCGG
jgi:hypothetical protein